MQTYDWYQSLIKPEWAPPAWVFGPAWTFLYVLIAISFGIVFYRIVTKKLPALVAFPFVLNLVFNFAFIPIQFGLRNSLLAAIDILLILGMLVWAIAVIYPYSRWIAFIQLPYLLWIVFATALQLSITFLNP